MHRRTAIRHYAVEKLKRCVDIGGRVYANRPSPLMLEELPCICVYFDAEPANPKTGSKQQPTYYERNMVLNIDIINEDPIDADATPETSQKNEDMLDDLAFQAECAFYDDIFFAKELAGYNPQDISTGLVDGVVLTNTIPYTIGDDGERRIVAQRLQFNVIYETPGFLEGQKFKDLNTIYFKINKVGFDDTTVDPTLTEGEIDYET